MEDGLTYVPGTVSRENGNEDSYYIRDNKLFYEYQLTSKNVVRGIS